MAANSGFYLQQDLSIVKDDDLVLDFEVLDEAGAAVDLTGATPVVLTIKTAWTGGTTVTTGSLAGGEVSNTNFATGIIAVSMSLADIPVGKYVYDLKLTDGGLVRTYFRGTLHIVP